VTITATQLNVGDRGFTSVNSSGFTYKPFSAAITLDDNGGGGGWYFDRTPNDDVEFTAVANSGSNGTGTSFQASFVDATTNNTNYKDFYRTITHEIGHALGIASAICGQQARPKIVVEPPLRFC
jgi:hypothetical protein